MAMLLAVALLSTARAAEPDESQTLSLQQARKLFADRVQPLLQKKCFGCHGEGDELESNFDMRTREGLLQGGELGAALTPGNPHESAIFQAVLRTGDIVMPPKERNKLTAAEIKVLEQWIAAGAPWSKPEQKDWGTYDPADLWAFQPIEKPAVPAVAGAGASPIDAFIAAKLAEKNLPAAPPADRFTLIRRATYDLTGLPPTRQEIEAFIKDDSLDAYPKLIERLLDSPRYGEKWGRHWLDVVRYADTAGFANDYERPNAWRYRDYVVRSFNDDKPFNRFILEQVAGDELYDQAEDKDTELLIAAGFLRLGPWEHTGMSVKAVTRQHFLDDVTNAVGVTFLGMGLRCASCHDHKFDPIPTRDYYRMQAVFAPTHFADRPVDLLEEENGASFEKGRARAQRLIDDAQHYLAGLKEKHNAAVEEFLQERGVKDVKDLPPDERPKRHHGLEPVELGLQKIYNKRRDYFLRELKRYEEQAFSVYSGPDNNYKSNAVYNKMPGAKAKGEVQEVFILAGGSLASPGDKVQPGVLSAAYRAGGDEAAADGIPQSMRGRRLALARWIASPENPLTSRVIVNRIWQHHFGKGIAQNPNNFGKMGKRPTHPQLLDYLAAVFMEEGWSIKQLHRLIMTSDVYRRAGDIQDIDQQNKLDPGNDLLAYFPPRRLTAEELRDSMLAASGELNFEMGGPGVYPEINWEVALQPRHIMGSVAPAYQPSPTPAERNRLTIYAFRYRTLADPMLEVFNQPGSEVSCEKRDETTVTPQVFALFNGRNTHRRALALAARAAHVADDSAARIETAFQFAYGRLPSDAERETCLKHLEAMTEHHRAHSPAEVSLPKKVSRLMVEELTGEEYQWDEELDVMPDYIRDLAPSDVSPRIRALADICLVLLNSNEFVYVY